jgi:hypothetical protein
MFDLNTGTEHNGKAKNNKQMRIIEHLHTGSKDYQIKEKGHSLHRAILFKVAFEKLCSLHVNSHGCKHNSEVVLFSTLIH